MNQKEALEESIKHWERMINWSSKQHKGNVVIHSEMKNEINETWGGEDCSLCVYNDNDCDECILGQNFKSCEHETNLWSFVEASLTWGEWTINARKFLKQLISLRGKT